MTFDVTFFSYGVGFVMLGWVVGMIIGHVFSLLRRIGYL